MNELARLVINEFSCISHADLEMTDVNVIIGPQGSGKSVTTKLFNFCTDIISDFQKYAEDGFSFSDYKKQLYKRFVVWFPSSAWGSERFNIQYSAGDFTVRILRKKIGGNLSDEVNISLSSWFEILYEFSINSYKEIASKKAEIQASEEYSATRSLELSWKVRNQVNLRIADSLGSTYYSQQTFIPAGRAFFTSIGRLVAGIEHAGSLDPVTLRFAKIFANWRDRSASALAYGLEDKSLDSQRSEIMGTLFDGRVFTKRDAEYIEMRDGRKVPFFSLSSGQQELMPIWYFLDNLLINDAMEVNRKRSQSSLRGKHLIYIEEPEAHLFPSAQSALMDSLISVILEEKSGRNMVITTHSPYIMTKLNVFLKAGQISRRKKKNSELNTIVPRNCWLKREQISAWCIEDGELKSIMDDDEGLIDARYLDDVSDVLSAEFDALLDLESSL